MAATGRQQRASSAQGRAHKPDLSAFYNNVLPDMRPGEFEFSLELLRGAGAPPFDLDPYTEGFDWADEEAVLKGTVNLRRPDPADGNSLPIGQGHRIRCKVAWPGHPFRELWTMRCAVPQPDPVAGTVTVEVADDLQALRRNKRRWVFRHTKARGRGWRSDEIIRSVAHREGIRLGKIVKGTKRHKKVIVEGTALDVIKKVMQYERDHTGKAFVVRMRQGRLEVVPYQRNRILYTIADQLEEAALAADQKERPFTVLEAKGRVGKGHDARKVKATIFDRAVVRRWGRVVHSHDFGRVDSRGDLLHRGRRMLAKELRVKRTAELTVPGIPFIGRGDTMRWRTNEPGWHGATSEVRDRSYVFVTKTSHTVASGGEYTSTFGIAQDDPFLKDQERREKEARAKARAKRKKKN